jgi:hypothetical protein
MVRVFDERHFRIARRGRDDQSPSSRGLRTPGQRPEVHRVPPRVRRTPVQAAISKLFRSIATRRATRLSVDGWVLNRRMDAPAHTRRRNADTRGFRI